MKQYKKLIFICENGTCRAPMAQAIFQEYRVKYPIEVENRAMVALFPEPLNQKAEAILISNGITVEGHVSKQLSEEDFSEDTLMIVMEAVQRERILQDFEVAQPEHVQVLTELVGDELEILNPYGGELPVYGLCYETLNKSIKKLVEKMNEEEE